MAATISVAGICLIERGTSWRAGEGWRAKSFRLLLRSPQDIVVLKTPSILEQWGAMWIVGLLAVVILRCLALDPDAATTHRRAPGSKELTPINNVGPCRDPVFPGAGWSVAVWNLKRPDN
jgi:hypothetical protein